MTNGFRRLVFIFVFFGLNFFSLPNTLAASSIDVSARVGDTEINLSGYTSPSSMVTFIENGAVVGTTVSETSGAFQKQFLSQDEGVHIIKIYSTAPDNKTTLTVNLSYVLIIGQTVELLNVYLPPTINAGSECKKNESLQVSGYATPNVIIQTEVSGVTGKTKNTKSGADGYYSDSFSCSDFSIGIHTVKSRLSATSSVSTISEEKSFEVKEAVSPTSTPGAVATTLTPVLNPIPTVAPCPYIFQNLCFLDRMKKGYLTLEGDFFDYLKNFTKLFEKPSRTVYDVNGDGFVDAVDLSIVLAHVKNTFDVYSAQPPGATGRSVLGAESNKLDYQQFFSENKNVNWFFILVGFEFALGLPVFFVSVILILIMRKYERQKR